MDFDKDVTNEIENQLDGKTDYHDLVKGTSIHKP